MKKNSRDNKIHLVDSEIDNELFYIDKNINNLIGLKIL